MNPLYIPVSPELCHEYAGTTGDAEKDEKDQKEHLVGQSYGGDFRFTKTAYHHHIDEGQPVGEKHLQNNR